ncbi:uracil phosphoribosyltransferase [Thamnocephalis sphaerospora]|uniref:uracil phosphoribosyltransferase n=1 Tax=Thamnocephalis sphaerospora TaxID=78915 RepID=A0A4P9XKR6_9FUNG|nr:uracil phosphoribosyltransferase [Thamnocephalis sphaerospora]|eukprot:RKP06398.1 uracil phosphoribosyltransferase [Thamnocephalis sphaerospora]
MSLHQVHVSQHPLVAHKLSLLRDKSVAPKQVRELVDELSMLLLTEATASLSLKDVGKVSAACPLQEYNAVGLKERVGLVPVLRSGLGMVNAGLSLLPMARVYHLGMYREKLTLQPVEYYNKLPEERDVDICIVLDPMIATGGTSVATVSALKDWGADQIQFVCICASQDGLAQLAAAHPDVVVHVGAIDNEIDANGYVMPGIGDSGDRLYNTPYL